MGHKFLSSVLISLVLAAICFALLFLLDRIDRIFPGKLSWLQTALSLPAVMFCWPLIFFVIAPLILAANFFAFVTGRDRVERTPQEYAAQLRRYAADADDLNDDDWLDLLSRNADRRLDEFRNELHATSAKDWKDRRAFHARLLALADRADALPPISQDHSEPSRL